MFTAQAQGLAAVTQLGHQGAATDSSTLLVPEQVLETPVWLSWPRPCSVGVWGGTGPAFDSKTSDILEGNTECFGLP